MRKFYVPFVLLCCLCFSGTFAQSLLINPTTNGGFESGAGFTANGWTAVNSLVSPDVWVVGGATVHAGAASAYISNDGGTTYTYDNNAIAPNVSHFYRDVFVPAGATSITLSFYLKGNIGSGSDLLSVYVVDASSPAPVADVSVSLTTAPVFSQPMSNSNYVIQTISLPGALANTTVRVIFSWENNGSTSGSNPPASVDNISLCTQPVAYPVTGGGGYCAGSSGVTVGLSNSEAGVSYQLLKDGSPSGSPVISTGGAIDFGLQTAGGTYTVEATSGTCTNTMSGNAVVTVNPIPTVSAGSPFTKTCTTNPSGAAIGETAEAGATYSWDPVTDLSNPSASNPIANPSVTTTYTVTKTIAGCSNTASVTVTVNNAGTTVSAGSPFTKTCTSNTAGGQIGETAEAGATYSWNPATDLSNAAASNPTANPSVTTTYTVTKTITATGCTATASVTVTVNNTPPAVSAGSPFTKSCTSNTAGAVIGEANDPSATYAWSPAAGLSSTTVSNPTANPAATTTYTVTKTDNTTGCTNSATVTVTVNTTPPAVSAGSPFTKTCTANINGAAIGEANDPSATYSWSPAAGLSSSTISNPIADPSATTTYTVTKTDNATGCSNTASVTVTVDNALPVVDITGSSSLCLPATTTLSPTSGGTWASSDNAVATVTNAGVVTGVSTGSVTFTFTQTSTGCTNTTSAVTVTSRPTVNAVPNQNVCKGAPTAAVNFTGTGTGTIYSWTNDNTLIGLAANGTGNIASFNAVNNGTTVLTANITVTPSIDGCTGNPVSFAITVDPTPTINNPGNQILCNGTPTAAIAFTGAVSGTVYNWTNNTPSIGLAASGTGDIASFNAINTGTANVVATITVTPEASDCGGTPISFTITVKPTPNVDDPLDQTVCNGFNTTAVNFTGTVPGTVYTWTNNTTSIGLSAGGTGNIPAFTATNSSGAPVTATITVTPSLNGCTGTVQTFTILVNPTATVTNPGNQTLCNGAPTTAMNFTGPVNWTNNTTSIGLAASGTGNIPSFTATNTGTSVVTATVTVTPTANGCNGTPFPISIVVNPTPTVAAVSSQTLCNGATTTAVNFSGTVPGTTFNWTNTTPSIGLAASGSGNIGAFTATNVTGAPVTATIQVTPVANSCPGTPTSFTITVNPTATVNNPGNQTVCKGAPTAAINFTGSVATATYNWTNTNTLIGLAASGTGNIPSFTATNTGATAISGTIAVSATANGCPGTSTSFTITVNPAAAINAMAANACSGALFTATPVDAVDGVVPAGTTYSWPAPSLPAGITGGAAGSGASITGTLTNSTANPLTVIYTVTPTSGTCAGPSFQLTVTVNPLPPKEYVSFFQTAVKSQQLCTGAQVGGGGQNDLDILFQPGNGQPATLYFDNNGFDWDWEYATGTAVGPTVPFSSMPGTTTTHYQQVLPPTPSVFSPIGDYWFRFALTKNGCTTYTDTIHLQVTSTLITKAGGPFIYCFQATPQPITLSGSSILGTSSGAITGQWSIAPGYTTSGTLSNTSAIPAGTAAGNANLSAVTFTPAAGFTGPVKLLLKSNDPDGGGICGPAIDTCYITILPLGNLQGCLAPANWTTTNTNANGSADASQTPCAETLIGGDNSSGTSGKTDYTICSGAGNFSFNWIFTAPTTPGPTPVWQTADQTVNSGAGTNRGSFIANRPANLQVGDLIVVILHARDNVGSVAAPDGFTSIRKDASGNSGSDNRGTVLSYWKIATAAEPATYAFQANSMGNNDTWVAVAGRVTGADPNNPIDGSNGANSGTGGVTTITAPAITTLGTNRLLISSVSILDNDHGTIPTPGGTTSITAGNSALGKRISYGDYFQNIPVAGTAGPTTFSWTASDAAATQLFAIKPAGIPDDSAWVIVNGVQTLLSGATGTQGSFTKAVNTNDVIGFRVTTKANNGGAGRLTFYSVNIPNDAPVATGTAAITIPSCNPATPSNFFVAPTVTDNCGGTPTLVSGYPQTGTTVTNGCTNTQTRTWLYQDACGLQTQPFTQTITWSTDATAPTINSCPPTQNFCLQPGNNYTIPALTATDNCTAPMVISYSISGATSRTGTGNDASGNFNQGISTIAWTVTDACGNTSTCSTTVNVNAIPTGTISVATGSPTTLCSGQSTIISVALTGTAPWSITYTDGGAPVTVTNITTSPYTFTVTPGTTTTWTLTAVNGSNCSQPGTFSGSAVVTVRQSPTAVISGNATICSGSPTNISIAPTGTAPWTVTYTDGTTPVTVSGITSSPYLISVSPTTNTTYTITALNDANCAGTFSGSAVIQVNPKPTVIVTPSSAVICTGGSASLTASGASTYLWTPSAGLSSTTAPTVVANPSATTTYTVTGTDANNCSNTATVTVTVNTPPATTGVTICQGGAGTISSSTVCAGGTFTSGPNNPAAAVEDNATGTVAWVNPTNIIATGAPYATSTVTALANTRYLKATNYGFAIPAAATITGITVTINRRVTTGTITDNQVRVVKAGAVIGTSFGGGAASTWGTSFATATFGGGANLWGTTWTPAEINNAGFGAALSVKGASANRNVEVDYIQITVTYTLPATLNWYTVASGGTPIGSGTPFNPVGVAGSGLANTNTPGTTIYYAECVASPGCRTATNFVINGTTVAGTLSTPAPACTPASGTLTLTGNTGNVVQWESSINNGTSWTVINNTTTSLTYTASAQTTLYRALVQNAPCASVYSTIATVGFHNVWTGVTSSDWFTPSNWSDGQLPTNDPTCPTVTIPQVTAPAVYPVLTAGTGTVRNIVVNANASLIVTNGTLQIAGTITNNGTFDVTNGTIEFNGTSGAQSIPANVFTSNKIKDILVNNDVFLNGQDSLTGTLSFGGSNKTFTTNGNLTLKSTATSTGAVGQIINGNAIAGEVIVERFMSAKRAWRFLAVPTVTTQNFHQAWQENMPQGSATQTSPPGYGTQVTNHVTPTPANGFDYDSPDGPSVKKYDITATGPYAPYKSINTVFDNMTTKEGLMTFVRGDRRSQGLGATPYVTVLRTKGTLYTGTQPPMPVAAGQFASIGNPYAAPLDMRNITKDAGINDIFYLWDPKQTGTNGFGAFQTFTLISGQYYPTPGGGSYPVQGPTPLVVPYNYIQSGSAFFVSATGNSGGNLTITENAKAAPGSVIGSGAFRPAAADPSITDALLRTNLLAIEEDASTDLVDGTLSDFGDYSNSVDKLDAVKIFNFGENLALKTDNQLLVVERRKTITEDDTLHLNMLKMKVKSYRFQIMGQNFKQPDLIAILRDSALNINTPINLNGVTTYDFIVNRDSALWNPSRFMIVFKAAEALPVTFSKLKAYQKEKNISVEWIAENDGTTREYEVEKSADGHNFTYATTIAAQNNGSSGYQWLDINALAGYNYYRIKSIDVNGNVRYSNIVRVLIVMGRPQVKVYPNPINTGNINVHFINEPKGRYLLRLTNKAGQLLMVKQIEREEGSSIEKLAIRLLAHGHYQLEVTLPDNTKTNINILY